MARKRTKAYPLEFRQKVVELARSGRLPDDLAAEFELQDKRSVIGLNNRISIAVVAATVYPAKSESKTRLRRENKQLKIEREILSKAAADSMSQRNNAAISSAGVAYCNVFRGR